MYILHNHFTNYHYPNNVLASGGKQYPHSIRIVFLGSQYKFNARTSVKKNAHNILSKQNQNHSYNDNKHRETKNNNNDERI